jgi:hypothetical protein
MPGQGRSYVARGDIAPSVFVKQLAGTDHSVVQAAAGNEVIGISHEGTRDAPVDGVTPLAAKTGESVRIYVEGEPCEIVAAAAIQAGDHLKPDANGKAVVAAAGELYGAVAAAGAAIGERAKVTVRRGKV